MKKKIALMVILAVSIAVSLYIEALLEPGKSTVIFSPLSGMKEQDIEHIAALIEDNTYIKNSTIYFIYRGIYTGNVFSKAPDTAVYGVDEGFMAMKNLKLERGRWILENDLKDRKPYAVVSEKTAVKLYSCVECIGMPLYIGEQEFKVIGIYKERESIPDNMAKTDNDVIFVPYTDMDIEQNTTAGILIRTKDGLTDMFLDQIHRNIRNIVPCNMQSIDRETRKQLNVKNLSFLVVYLIILLYGIKIMTVYIKKRIGIIGIELERVYVKQLIKLYYIDFIKMSGIVLLFIASALILYKLLRFQFYIEPGLIPKRLIDFGDIIKKIASYYINKNNNMQITDTMNSLPGYAGGLLAASGLVSAVSSYCLVKCFSAKREVR